MHTGHTTLYDFSTRQHLFHWTRSVTTEQPRLTLVYSKMWDVIQQRVYRLTLTTRSSIHHERLTWH